MLKALLDAVEETLRARRPGGHLRCPDGYQALIDALISYDGSGTAAPAATTPPAVAEAPVPRERRRPSTRARHRAVAAPSADADRREHDQRQADRRQGDRRHGDRRSGNEADQFVRVRTDRLDRLIDMVGELVIAQSMIAGDETLAAAGAGTHHELTKKIAHAGKIVRELQDLSMSMRMVPLKATFQKLTRLVRDVAREARQGGRVRDRRRGHRDRPQHGRRHRRSARAHGAQRARPRRRARPTTARRPASRASGRVTLSALPRPAAASSSSCPTTGAGSTASSIARKAIEQRAHRLRPRHDRRRGVRSSSSRRASPPPTRSPTSRGRGVGMDVVKRNIETRARPHRDRVGARAGDDVLRAAAAHARGHRRHARARRRRSATSCRRPTST